MNIVTTQIARFANAFDHDWSVTRFGDFVVVEDSATTYWMSVADLTKECVDELYALIEQADGYSHWCSGTPMVAEADVPKVVLMEAARELGREEIEDVADLWDDGDCDDRRAAGVWTSEDGQREIDMTGATVEDAIRFLLDQCSTDEERAGILAGELEVGEVARGV